MVRRNSLTFVLLVLVMVTWMMGALKASAAILTFSSAPEYLTASRASKPGDTIKATGNVSLGSDTDVPIGVTLDLGGFTLSAPPPTTDRPLGYRFLRIVGSGTTIQNGKIDNAGWGIFTAYSCSSITIRNLSFTRVRMAALKISPNSGAGGTRTDNLALENLVVTSEGRPNTLVDLGPGTIGTTSIKHLNITGPPIDPNYNNTACDGLGIEDGQGPITIDDVQIQGAPGDGMDVKNATDLSISNVTISNVNRNGLKVWCYQAPTEGAQTATASAVVTNAKISGCGLEAIAVGAGNVTVKDSIINSPTVCANWGNGTVNGCRVTVLRTKFNRTGTSTNALQLCDGGDGKPILSDPVRVTFDSCDFDPGQASNMFLVKVGSPMVNLTVADARAGRWPSNWTNCTVTGGTTVEPPIVTPPPPSDLAKLQAQVTALSTKLDAYIASQTAKWSNLATAIGAK